MSYLLLITIMLKTFLTVLNFFQYLQYIDKHGLIYVKTPSIWILNSRYLNYTLKYGI